MGMGGKPKDLFALPPKERSGTHRTGGCLGGAG